MQFIWKYVDDMIGKGLEWQIIVELLFYTSTTFVPLALPLAVLLSSLMIFGNLGERYELAAIKSAGVSLNKAMRPLVIVSLLISVTAFYFSNNILPIANLKMATLLYDVRGQKPALNIKEGIYYKGIENYVIKIGKKERDGKTIHNILIYDHTSKRGNTTLTIAKHGVMQTTADKKYLIFTLYEGFNYEENANSHSSRTDTDPNAKSLQRTSFKENMVRFDLSSFQIKRSEEEFFKDNCQMQNLSQLVYTMDSLQHTLDSARNSYSAKFKNFYVYYTLLQTKKKDSTLLKIPISNLAETSADKRQQVDLALNTARQRKSEIEFNKMIQDSIRNNIVKHDIEWHSKLALSVSCLILFFIGAPLGAIIRKGGLGWPLVTAVGFFLLFHILNTIGRKMAKEEAIDAASGIWLAPLILLPIGLFITFKATTDAPLLDADSWKRLFYRAPKK